MTDRDLAAMVLCGCERKRAIGLEVVEPTHEVLPVDRKPVPFDAAVGCPHPIRRHKWNGLAINGQYFVRWLDDFEADGPLPLASTMDHGGEVTVGQFVNPKKVMVYGRGSWVRGQF